MTSEQDLFAPDRLLSLIEEYSSFGIHRTGWAADDKVSDWLIEWLGRAGVSAATHAFDFSRVDTTSAYVEVGGVRVEGTPLYDGEPTGAAGVSGALARDGEGAAASILVLDEQRELARYLHAEDAGLAGAILVNGDAKGDIVLRNTERLEEPFNLPVLQVAPRDAGALLAPDSVGRDARLVLDFERRPAKATNVVGRLEGKGDSGLVVVMTPKSGWFTCASERGGGIAITMALAAKLAASPARRKEVLFLFTSGHELRQSGLANYLRDHPSLRDEAEVWVHLGASIGPRGDAGWRFLYSRDGDLRRSFSAALAKQGLDEIIKWTDKEQMPVGESRQVFDKRFVSIIGTHAYFHGPNDLPALAVDEDKVSRFGRAFAELLDELVV